MPTVLITGSNRGIGLELVSQFAKANCHVIAKCINPINVGELSKLSCNIEIHGLDTTNIPQLEKLAYDLVSTPIDLIICNAGIYGQRPQNIESCDIDEWLQVFRVNSIAPFILSKCFLSHLSKSKGKIAFLSSRMGSISENDTGATYQYRSSKAALNSIITSLAIDLKPLFISVCALHPGWVMTEMGGKNAKISAETSVNGIIKVIEGLTLSNSGNFYNYNGDCIGW